MEPCADSYELVALRESESTSDESRFERFNKKRQFRRRQRPRTAAVKQRLISSSSYTCNLIYKCCWHLLCIFFVGNLLWVFGLTWFATQLKTDIQNLRNITEKA